MMLPRLMVAAPSSGSGKTVVTCGLLRALQRAGRTPAAFKCGPDYLDPLFHRRVVGTRSGTLDAFFTDEPATLQALLARGAEGCDLAVIEGVMGYYDGMAPGSTAGSSYAVARATETPVVLVVDGRGASTSLAALVSGFASFEPQANVRGVILNRASEAACRYVAGALEERTGVPVLGYVPRDDAFALESRHLGLVTADEVAGLSAQVDRMAQVIERTVDLDRLGEVAAAAPAIDASPYRTPSALAAGVPRVRIAVARDDAFSFYYAENLRMLEDLGAELAFFSPLADEALPAGACGLYLGGGYPELHARALSENVAMRRAVRRAVAAGLPTVAECGGFLYLQEAIVDEAGVRWPLAGALPGQSENVHALKQFGYVELELHAPSLYGPAGTRVRAHEFHYWHTPDAGSDAWAQKPGRTRGWTCMHARETLVAGFPHVYWPANPALARSFVEAATRYRAGVRGDAEGKEGVRDGRA